MHRNFVPILAILIISGGALQLYAADYQPIYQQQAESACAVCHQKNLGDALFLVCNDHLLVTHKSCMQLRLQSGDMRCPQCNHELSEENLHLMLTSLNGGDVIPQATSIEPKAQLKRHPHWGLVNRGRRSLEKAEAHYADLKQLVFNKMGQNFAVAFNAEYPQSSKEAVEQLALHIDYIEDGWHETTPPSAKAIIGSEEIILVDDVACIIYNMRQRIKIVYECATPFVN